MLYARKEEMDYVLLIKYAHVITLGSHYCFSLGFVLIIENRGFVLPRKVLHYYKCS